MLHSYTTSLKADNEEFNKICREIEKKVADVKKEKLLVDVDGTQIQIYIVGKNRITVKNDYEVDAVYVDSEIDLGSFVKEE